MNDRHLAGVWIGEQSLGILLRDGATVRVTNGIPLDAAFLGVSTDWAGRGVIAVFEHPSFPRYPEGTDVWRVRVGFEVLQHPMAQTYDLIPLRIGMDAQEVLDMRAWICERAAEIEGREYNPKARMQ